MAIRLRHDAAAGLIGSFAAGQAAGQRRRQKYLFDALQRRQALQFQAARDERRFQEARDLLGQRNVQARDLLDIRGRQDLNQQLLRGEQQLELQGMREQAIERAGEQRLEQERVRGEFDIDQEFAEGIRRGELVLPPGTEEKIAELNKAEQNLDRMGRDAPEARQQILEKRRQLLRSASPPTVPETTIEEQISQNTFDHPKYGLLTIHDGQVMAVRGASSPMEMEQKRLEQSDAAREALRKAEQNLEAAKAGDEEMSPRQIKLLEEARDHAKEKLNRIAVGQEGVDRDTGFNVPGVPNQQPARRIDPLAADAQIPQPGVGDEMVAGVPVNRLFSEQAPSPTPAEGFAATRTRREQMRAARPATELPQVRSDADYDKLAEGTEFIDAETGKRYKKPFKTNREGPTFFDMMVR